MWIITDDDDDDDDDDVEVIFVTLKTQSGVPGGCYRAN